MASTSKAKATKAAAVATAHAVKMLQDPETREQLMAAGAGLAAQLRAWNADRTSSSGSGPAQPGVPATSTSGSRGLPTPAFGQERLERRTAKLGETLALLRGVSDPAAAPTLDEVDVAISRIRLSLAVAKNLPVVKRTRAQREINRSLSELEDAVMQAAMGRSAT
ncbi:hypothetical protein BH10ACT3_BH10ACT3_20450 [soil metagenome]